jgi:uncharacterized protein YicC (UPF0701 family)
MLVEIYKKEAEKYFQSMTGKIESQITSIFSKHEDQLTENLTRKVNEFEVKCINSAKTITYKANDCMTEIERLHSNLVRTS